MSFTETDEEQIPEDVQLDKIAVKSESSSTLSLSLGDLKKEPLPAADASVTEQKHDQPDIESGFPAAVSDGGVQRRLRRQVRGSRRRGVRGTEPAAFARPRLTADQRAPLDMFKKITK